MRNKRTFPIIMRIIISSFFGYCRQWLARHGLPSCLKRSGSETTLCRLSLKATTLSISMGTGRGAVCIESLGPNGSRVRRSIPRRNRRSRHVLGADFNNRAVCIESLGLNGTRLRRSIPRRNLRSRRKMPKEFRMPIRSQRSIPRGNGHSRNKAPLLGSSGVFTARESASSKSSPS